MPRDAASPTAADFGLPEAVPCPFCGGRETELHSPFGGQLSTATYWCRRCRSAFEFFKRSAPNPEKGSR